MGETSCALWPTIGLDTIFGGMATANTWPSTGDKLVPWFRVGQF